MGAHAKDPLGHGEFGRLLQQGLPTGRLQRVLLGCGPALEVPEAAAVIGHHQVASGPDRLKDRDGLGILGSAAGDAPAGAQLAGGLNVRQPEAAAVPGHGRLLPLHPGQPRSIGAQGGIAAEVRGLMELDQLPAGQG